MKRFLELWRALDESNKTNDKLAALEAYFREAAPADAAWALALLSGKRPRVPINRTLLRRWATEQAGIEDWLFDECYAAVGDLSETISLILPDPVEAAGEDSLAGWMDRLAALAGLSEPEQRETIEAAWRGLDADGRFILHKLIGGAFRVGASKELALKGLSRAKGVPVATLAHRAMGDWTPSESTFLALVSEADQSRLASQPYPFCLAHPLEGGPDSLGSIDEWQAEWKWDGIRAQLIRRAGQTFLWSRGEDLIHLSFPEIIALGEGLPEGTVLDGEILAWDGDRPAPFAQLQRRLGRKTVGKKLLQEIPCTLVCFDLLEWQGQDLRNQPIATRRRLIEAIPGIRVSPTVEAESWEELARRREGSREMRAEGLMLKRRDSLYEIGRKKGAWWKWKIEPFSIDAVLIYAQQGTGKRASLYTDYTFGVWHEGALVPFAKAYSGLSDEEIREVDRFIRGHILEKFGPVRTVQPELVFEIAFEGIQLSARHKSGVAVRFPRIARMRKDKAPKDADSLQSIHALLRARA